jgi:hypothetical protein
VETPHNLLVEGGILGRKERIKSSISGKRQSGICFPRKRDFEDRRKRRLRKSRGKTIEFNSKLSTVRCLM